MAVSYSDRDETAVSYSDDPAVVALIMASTSDESGRLRHASALRSPEVDVVGVASFSGEKTKSAWKDEAEPVPSCASAM